MSIRTAFGRMISARERHARMYVNAALLNLDDETLRRAGYEREELKRRPTRTFPY